MFKGFEWCGEGDSDPNLPVNIGSMRLTINDVLMRWTAYPSG